MSAWIITVAMPGYLPNGDAVEPFEATDDEALDALLDEAETTIADEHDDCQYDEGCLACSDEAFIESLRGAEGRGDLLFHLRREGSIAVRIECYANGFGAVVELAKTADPVVEAAQWAAAYCA